MFIVDKKMTLPIGHRLSKHLGRCSSIHGHNLIIHVGVSAKKLNENDMVMDFGDLKRIMKETLDVFDHCLLVNVADKDIVKLCSAKGMRIISVDCDPTAERFAEELFYIVKDELPDDINMHHIKIYENDNSSVVYKEDHENIQ